MCALPERSFSLALVVIMASPLAFPASQDGLLGADFAAAKFNTAPGATRIEVSDLDGDGYLDVVTAPTIATSEAVMVLFGRGDGTFEPVMPLPLGERPERAVSLDIDGDGDGDVVSISRSPGGLFVFENLTGRAFAAPVSIGALSSPRDVAIVDYDGDGVLDVLVADQGAVVVFEGDGAGGFALATSLPLGLGVARLELGDVNGDGRTDLLASAFIGPAFELLLATPSGFGAPTTVTAGASVRNPVLRDADGDGALDLAFVEWNAPGVFFMAGNGDGTFEPAVRTVAGDDPQSVEVADLNGDGAAEFIVTRESTFGSIGGRVVVIDGDPVFVFGSVGPAQRSGSNPRATAIRDFDADGRLDVAVLNNIGGDVAILRGLGDGTLEVPDRVNFPVPPAIALAGDFDGDGEDDLVAVGEDDGRIVLRRGRGDGTFTAAQSSSTGVECFFARAGDVDGDGDLDVMVLGRRSFAGELAVALNDGSGSFSLIAQLPHDEETGRVLELGDLNGDGTLDIVTTGFFSRLVTWLGNGDGTFNQGPNGTGFESARGLALGDVNGDGWLDGVATDPGDRRIDTYLGDGTGLLTRTFDLSIDLVGARPIALGDVDGDGQLDACVSGLLTFPDQSGVAIYRGMGDGTFTFWQSREVRNDVSELLAVDLDGDGRADVVAVQSTAVSDLEVFKSGPGGQLGRSVLYSGSLEAGNVAAADFNSDGNPDLAFSSPNANDVTVLMNRAEVRLDSYCTPEPNSTGARARLTAEGSRSLAALDLRLEASEMPGAQTVVWFAGGQPGSRLMQGANLCIAGPLMRIAPPAAASGSGTASLDMALSHLPLIPGQTVYFQAWFTDPTGLPPFFNFTEGLALRPTP